MTQDEIIRFAIQCRLVTTGNRDGLYMDALMEFANLVAAKISAQPKQEPTKAMIDAAERINWSDSDVRGNIVNMWQAMYAVAPPSPQRTWVGLTDEEIQECYNDAYKIVQGRRLENAFYKTIEAKLKERNT